MTSIIGTFLKWFFGGFVVLAIVLFSLNFNNENIGIITAIYPTVWGVGQLFTGKMSDHYSKKGMLF